MKTSAGSAGLANITRFSSLTPDRPRSADMRKTLVLPALLLTASCVQAAAPAVVNRLRFFPAPEREQAMIGGKVTGSNTSDHEGFEAVAEITEAPKAGQWNEVSFANTKLYRWIRYEAPPGSHGNVAELEFYAGEKLLPGKTFGSFGWRGLHNWPRVFDKKTDTYFDSDIADGQYAGVDIGELATAQMPRMDPPPGNDAMHGPVDVALRCNTPGAVVRYSFSGVPGPDTGNVCDKPVHLDKLTTIFAVAFKDGMPASPAATGTYPAGTGLKQGLRSFHVGNSLTASTLPFPSYAKAAGYSHEYHSWLKDGGNTPAIWNNSQTRSKADWDHEFNAMPGLDHFSVQPRLPAFTPAPT